jgi:prepilin-type N-terminal cleavage/methylation domain-containing protein
MNVTTIRSDEQRGFSLIETLVSMTIFLFVLMAVLQVYTQSHRLYARGERTADVQDNGRQAMAEMARQIRLAGWFPENFSASPPSPALDNPLRVATDASLSIYGDADNTGASQVYTFCVTNGELRRTTGATGTASSYGCTSGVMLAQNVTSLRFTYYDASGNAVPNPPNTPYTLDSQAAGAVPNMTTTTARDSVRRVLITLTVKKLAGPNRYQQFPLVSNVWLRNAN